MKTVGDICEHVSFQLNDQRPHREFSRWSRALLVEYLNQALKEIATYKPDAFSETIDILLQPGRIQKLRSGVTLRGLLGPDGVPAPQSEDAVLKAFLRYAPCPPRPRMVNGRLDYNVKSYSVDSADSSMFYVSPPVPAGANVTMRAQVDGSAKEYTLKHWNDQVFVSDKYYNNMIDYMMARAYRMDSESQVSAAEAGRLLNLFYQTMGAKYKIEAARNSGYYNGEIGTGDRSARL